MSIDCDRLRSTAIVINQLNSQLKTMLFNGSGSGSQTLAQRKAALRLAQKAEKDNLAAQHKNNLANISTWGKQQIATASTNLKNVRATVKNETDKVRTANKAQKDAMAASHKAALAALS